MSCAVGQFVKGCAVILCRFCKLLDVGKHNAVGEGSVVSAVAAFVDDPDAASLDVCGDDAFCGFISVCRVGEFRLMLGFQPFALVDVEHIVVAEEGNLLLFVGVFVFLLDELPENYHRGFFALLHLAAFLLALSEGQVFAGSAEKHLIEKAVRLACGVADCIAAGYPRFLPRDDPAFELGDDAVADFLVDIHMLCPFC